MIVEKQVSDGGRSGAEAAPLLIQGRGGEEDRRLSSDSPAETKPLSRVSCLARRGPVAALSVILIVGTGLRFFRLGSQSLWIDEVAQVQTASAIDTEGFGCVAGRDNVAPLSHWLLWAWIKVAGKSELAIRAPAAVFGVLTILLLYFLGRALFSPAAGLFAGAILAVSPLALWYSQDGRMYSHLIFLSALIMLVFWRAIQSRSHFAYWPILALVTAVGLYTHQFTANLAVACGLFLVFSVGLRNRRLWFWVASQAAAVGLFLPWLLWTFTYSGAGSAGYAKGRALMWAPYTLFTFAFGFSLGPSVSELHWNPPIVDLLRTWPYVIPFAVVALGLCLVGVVAVLKRPWARPGAFCVLCLTVPVALAILLACLVPRLSYNVRYAVVAVPAFALVLSAGLARYGRTIPILVLGALFTVGVLWSLVNAFTSSRYWKEDYRGAAPFLREHVSSEDSVIISSCSTRHPLVHYGFQPPKRTYVAYLDDLDTVLKNVLGAKGSIPGRIWLIEARRWESDPNARLRQALDGAAELLLHRSLIGLSVRCYRRLEPFPPREGHRPSDTNGMTTSTSLAAGR